MECNRDEANRAKTIAEKKITERDFAAAKKFALKAKSLYPGLEGLSQMLTTIDVYISAENKISGEIDWYGVLGVNPSADDDTVRKQYRKLALMLHPDKNKSVGGGDGAFKLLSEAWTLLSDKVKRLEYNLRRSSQPKVPAQGDGKTATPHTNGFHNFSNRTTSNKRTLNNTAWQNVSSAPPAQRRSDTFWTICHRCKMHYEYLKIYLNNTLICPNCHKAFVASETSPPFNFSQPSNVPSPQNLVRPAVGAQNLGGKACFGSTEPSVAAKGAHIVQCVNEKMKREREELHATTGRECGNRPLKNRRGLDNNSLHYGGNIPSQTGMVNNAFEKGRIYGYFGVNGKPNSTRELTHLEIRSMLMKKAQMEIRKKLKELNLKALKKAVDAKKEKEANILKGKELNKNGEYSDTRGACDSDKHINSTSADQDNIALSMNVPDPDFHDFDGDRMESSFEDNQVWAAYDDDDGMPRFYAMIHKVISRKPFKMKISWLNSKSNSEFGPLNWVGYGFFKTCGEFRIGKHEMNKSINSFSHKVGWTKGARGAIQILPKKGDVWALYKYWSPEWNEHTPDEVIHKYDMMEVLEDYNEEAGAIVAPLIKVAGFRTVFHPHVDPDKIRKIPREEMFRFSHRVPNYLLTGQEAPNAPKGCQELDPAATPLEFLYVITEANEVPAQDNGGKVEEDMSGSGPKIRKNEAIDAATKTKLEETVENDQQA